MGSAAKGNKRAAPVAAKSAKKAKVAANPPSPESESSEIEELGDELEEASEDDDLDELDDKDDDEDELDELDEEDISGGDEDDEEAENGDGVAKRDPNKQTSKEQHAEQKKKLSERKLQRKAGTEVAHIKSLWEKLRVNKPTPPKEVREKLCNQIWDLSKDVVLDLVMKHDASRVVQTLVKYSTKERRDKVVEALKGNYYQLATSSYGKYLLVKLLHYGLKESRALIVNELHGKLRKLMRHKEGAYVVEDLYVLYSTAEQKYQMIREFWGSEYATFKDSGKGKSVLEVAAESSERRQLIMTNLVGTITASVEKGSTGFQILHAAMREYTTLLTEDLDANDTQIREFIDLLAEQVAELVHTPEGAEVASTLIALANAKERKTLVKTLRQHSDKLIKNEHGNLVLITMFMTVDDTKLTDKAFSQELFTPQQLPELVQDKFSRRPILYLLKGLDGRYFAPKVQQELLKYEKLAYQKTSKKDQAQRRKDLQAGALPVLYESLLAAEDVPLEKLLSSNIAAQFITELILTSSDNKKVNDTLRPKLVDQIFDMTIKGDVLEDFHLVNKTPFISRSIKALVQGTEYKWDNGSKKLVRSKGNHISGVGAELAAKIADHVLESGKLGDWASGQGAFVLVAVYEVLQLLDEKEQLKALTKALKKIRKDLVSDKDNKGAQLLASLVA